MVLGFLVGNDFVPHLPNLHIREDALPTVYRCYKQVLPTLDGERDGAGTGKWFSDAGRSGESSAVVTDG